MSGRSGSWTVGRLVGYSALIAGVTVLSQIAVLFAIAILRRVADPTFDTAAWLESGESNGLLLSVAGIATTIVCIPFVVYLVRRVEPDPSATLGTRVVGIRTIVSWCVALVIFLAASDLITVSLGRPLVPDIMVADYLSGPPVLLFLALVIFAPLSEELIFRGFLLGVLQNLGLGQWPAILLTAGLFAIVHIQYDLYGIVSIFAMAILVGLARWKSGSLFPCIAMHSVANLIAFIELVFVARAAVV